MLVTEPRKMLADIASHPEATGRLDKEVRLSVSFGDLVVTLSFQGGMLRCLIPEGVRVYHLREGVVALRRRTSFPLLSTLCPVYGTPCLFRQSVSNDLGSLGENQQGAQAPFVPGTGIRSDESSCLNLNFPQSLGIQNSPPGPG